MGKKETIKKSKTVAKTVEDSDDDLSLPESSEEEISPGEELAESEEESEDKFEEVSDDSESEEEVSSASEIETPKKQAKVPLGKHTVDKSSGLPIDGKRTTKTKSKTGVIYIGRVPPGFEEHELQKYFAQFGDIVRLRLSRNKKTGKSKHYGFIEFKDRKVAEIAAETMHNYLLFGHLLQVHLVDDASLHQDLFKGSMTKYKAIPWAKMAQRNHDGPKLTEKREKLTARWNKRKQLKLKQLADKGIDFDLEEVEPVDQNI